MKRYEQLAAAYLEELRPRLTAPTLEQRRRMLQSFHGFLQASGVRDIDGITGDTIRAYNQYLRQSPISRSGQYQRRTGYIRTRLLQVAAFFRHLAAQKKIPADPFAGVELPPPPFFPRRHVLTEAEVSGLLAAPAVDQPLGLRDRAMFELAYGAGLRARELAALDVADVDLAAGRVTVRAAELYPERTSAVGAAAVAWLGRYLSEVRPVQLRESRERALFLSNYGERFVRVGLCEVMRRYGRRVGLGRRFGWVALRRTCAARLLREGADELTVRALLDPPLPAVSAGDPRMYRR